MAAGEDQLEPLVRDVGGGLERLDPGERRSVIAHELSHAESEDLPKGLLWVALVTPLSLLFAGKLAAAISRRDEARLGTPAALPALALALAITSFGIGVIGNAFSRRVEARADQRAMELTEDPEALIRLQRKSALINVSDPSPPSLFAFLYGTHPTKMERIGQALAYQRGRGEEP